MQHGRHGRSTASAPHPAPPKAPARANSPPDAPKAKNSAAWAALQQDAAAHIDDDWALGPRRTPAQRRRRALRIGLGALFLLAVAVIVPLQLRNLALRLGPAAPAVTARPRPTFTANLAGLFAPAQAALEMTPAPVPTPTPTPAPTAAPTPAPTAVSAQQALLEEAVEEDLQDSIYDSATDYFGGDDVFLEFYDILEDVQETAAPVPTAPPATPDSALPASSAAPDSALPVPSATPDSALPAPPPAADGSGPVLQGSGSAACVRAYNAWDPALKQYTWDMAKAYGLRYDLVLAIIYHESKFNAAATHQSANGTTVWGLMQISDVCYPLLHQQLAINSMADLLDPYKAVQAGCAILAYHLRYTGNADDALLRYQVGAGNYTYYKSIGTYPKSYTNTLALRDSYAAAGI